MPQTLTTVASWTAPLAEFLSEAHIEQDGSLSRLVDLKSRQSARVTATATVKFVCSISSLTSHGAVGGDTAARENDAIHCRVRETNLVGRELCYFGVPQPQASGYGANFLALIQRNSSSRSIEQILEQQQQHHNYHPSAPLWTVRALGDVTEQVEDEHVLFKCDQLLQQLSADW